MTRSLESYLSKLPSSLPFAIVGEALVMVCLDGMTVKISRCDGGWIAGRYYDNGNCQSAAFFTSFKQVVENVVDSQ